MARVVVVTGTDTEVGKTFVTAALIHRLRAAGKTVRAVKPVESGCESSDPSPGEDGVILATAAGQATPPHAVQRLQAPLAPPVAAELEGVSIRDDAWGPLIADLADGADIVFVEAAGGLFSPLSTRFDALSLAKHLGADILVVAADKLGTINHSRLTLTALQHAGISTSLSQHPCIAGFIFSEPAVTDESTGRNAEVFRSVADFPRVAEVRRHGSYRDAADDVGAAVEWFTD